MQIANEHLTRQIDLLPTRVLNIPITVIGCGAIGGWTTLLLAKMGFNNITVYDFDDVSIENMNCQFFRFSDIGKNKASSLKEIVKDFTNVDIVAYNERFNDQNLTRLVICCVDSMEARKNIFSRCKNDLFVRYFLDARMAIEFLNVYCVDIGRSKETKEYSSSLFSDTEAVQEPCTNKSISYTASIAGALLAKCVKDIAINKPYSRLISYNIAKNAQLCWNINEDNYTTA